MQGKIFLDADIIIKANDKSDFTLQTKAIEVVKRLITKGRGVISTQVMQEYAQTASEKLGQKQSAVLRQLKILETFEIVNQTPVQVQRAFEIKHLYEVSFADAMVISAAEQANCLEIYSQSLKTEPFYSGIKITNPLNFS
jgi:predicted nucleic acid-binding protein